jgi:hypothetical protein
MCFEHSRESSSAVGVSRAFALSMRSEKYFLALAERSSVRSLRSGDSNRIRDIFLQKKLFCSTRESFDFVKSGRRRNFLEKIVITK